MKIYEHELQDGIKYLNDRTFAECNILSFENFTGEITENLAKSIANYIPSNPNQIDLHYLNCVLASVGWNKNDDVFDKEEFIKARFTPEDKPFNYMHDESDIIGHITGSTVYDHDGKEVDFSLDVPDNLDIVVSAVIYKSWSDVEQFARIKELIEEIKNSQWAVSMECLFRSFDYALVDELGNHKIIARNQDSAFLTKHLKSYGGTGVYDKYKIGRLLRNITYSGIGIVKRPANSRSIILNNDNFLGEQVMPDPVITASVEDSVDFKAKAEELQNTLEAVNQEHAVLKTVASEKEEKIQSLNADLDQAKAEVTNLTDQLEAMKNKIRCMERRSVLASMKMDSEMIEECLEDFNGKDDEAFASAVKMFKKLGKSSVAEVVTTQEVTTETETDVEVEEVEETVATELETAPSLEENTTDKVQASISEWFKKSVLSSTKNLK